MRKIRHNSPNRALRVNAALQVSRIRNWRPPPAQAIGSELGERLGIAAVYAGRGDEDSARAAALLAAAGLPDGTEFRAAVLAAFESIQNAVQTAVNSQRTRQ